MILVDLIRCENSNTPQTNKNKADEIMEVCAEDAYFRERVFEASDLQTVGYMRYVRDTGLELRESVDGVRALFIYQEFGVHSSRLYI